MNKILIIDDDRELCALIKRSVQSENIEADFCNTGREGLQKLKEQEYQLVVLDVMMPGMDGFETLEEIRKENSLPILMFTSKNDSASKVRGLRAGADDYLTKPFELEELWARIQVQLRRTQGIRPSGKSVLKYKDWTINLQERSFIANKLPVELTSHEMGILELLIKHPKKVFTKQEIFEVVWQQEYFIEDKTIHVHISNIRAKLKKTGTDHYIQTVWGIGFKLGE